MKVPDTLMAGVVSKLSKNLGFLPKTNSYGLKFTRFRLLNKLYTKVANDRYFGHICPN